MEPEEQWDSPPVYTKERRDEDVDENAIKDSWEDYDDDDDNHSEPAAAPVADPSTSAKKSVTKPSEKKGKAIDIASKKKGKAVEIVKDEPLDPVAEKLRQQRIVEEADFRNTVELFAKRGGNGNSLENFIPKSESDFLEYAELISQKLRPYEKSYHYIGLLKSVMRLSMTNLKGADAKEVSSCVTAISNEKIRAEKEANAGKKKSGPKKKQLLIDKPDDDAVINNYDTMYDEEDEFM